MNEQKGFDALQTRDVVIERNGETRTFRVTEYTKLEAQSAFNITKSNGKRDHTKAKQVDSRLIASAVKIVGKDGALGDITFDQAERYPQAVSRELVAAVLEINGIGGEDADEKN